MMNCASAKTGPRIGRRRALKEAFSGHPGARIAGLIAQEQPSRAPVAS